ncbi:MAG: SIR2 family protein [Magnetococcus sp. DMHC-1]
MFLPGAYALLPEQTVFLVGAGISIDAPSGIPPAHPILRALCRWIAGDDAILADQLLNRCRPSNVRNPFDFIRFEALIQAITLVIPDFLGVLRTVEADGLPNAHHLFLMAEASRGATVLTTNFDTRMEMAAEWMEFDPDRLVLSPRRQRPGKNTRLVKLHGSFPYRRSGRHLPRATLNQIGVIGLGFAHFPGFRNWFSQMTEGRTLYVLGYSASDSFDVVPLIEDYCQARKVVWFDFMPGLPGMRTERVKRGNGSVLPSRPSTDFVGMTLARLRHQMPEAAILRVCGPSLGGFLRRTFKDHYRLEELALAKTLTEEGMEKEDFARANLHNLEEMLASSPLEEDKRQIILARLLEDGAFGESFTRPDAEGEENPRFEEAFESIREAVDQGDLEKAWLLAEERRPDAEDDPEEMRLYLYSSAMVNFEQGRIREAVANLEQTSDILLGEETDWELKLMVGDMAFSASRERDDLEGMAWAAEKVFKGARQSGVVWGLILWHWMKAMELEQQARKGLLSDQKGYEKKLAGLEHARLATYY